MLAARLVKRVKTARGVVGFLMLIIFRDLKDMIL
jgi:hypothetical protein